MEIRLRTAEEFRDAHVTIEIRATQGEIDGTDPGTMAGQEDRIQDLEAQLETVTDQRLAGLKRIHELNADKSRLMAEKQELDEVRKENSRLRAQSERRPRGHICVDGCKPNAHVAFEGRRRVTELLVENTCLQKEFEEGRNADHELIMEARKRADEAEQRAREYDVDRHSERDRADNNRAWAESAEARADQMTAERDRALAEVERRFTQAQLADQIAQQTSAHRQAREEAQQAQIMLATQIGKVRAQVLGLEIRKVLDGGPIDALGNAELLVRRIRNIRDIVAPGGPEAPAANTSQA